MFSCQHCFCMTYKPVGKKEKKQDRQGKVQYKCADLLNRSGVCSLFSQFR